MLVEYVRLFRTCWLSGRRGGGKTSLAVALALRLVADGYADKIVSNTPLRLGLEVAQTDADGARGLEDCVIILDEAWQHLGLRSRVRGRDAWLAYLRHRNQYLLLPSVLDLCPEVRNFVVERDMSLTRFGLPLWVYSYSLSQTALKGRKKRYDVGRYYWWHPGRVFRYYDHLYNPGEVYHVYEFTEGSSEAAQGQ